MEDIDKKIQDKIDALNKIRLKQTPIFLVWARYEAGGPCPIITLRAVTTNKIKAELYELLIIKNNKKDGVKDVWIEERISNHCYGACMSYGSSRTDRLRIHY